MLGLKLNHVSKRGHWNTDECMRHSVLNIVANNSIYEKHQMENTCNGIWQRITYFHMYMGNNTYVSIINMYKDT